MQHSPRLKTVGTWVLGSTVYSYPKIGHIRKVCRQPKRPPTSQGRQTQRHPVRTVQEGNEDPVELSYVLHTLRAQSGQPLEDGKPLCMEVETGAAMSLVSEKTYRSLFPERCLQLSKACLRTYSGESITVIGQVEVEVCYEEQRVKVPLLVVKGEGPSLFGRDWLTKIHLDWGAINTVKCKTLQVCWRDTAQCVSQAMEHCRDTRPRFMLTQELSQNIAKHGQSLMP